MRIPRKKELLELQRKYRTDRKIGEVYGVPARLVAYWRSKKKIGSYSFPKYTEEKIRELWERFGNDARGGEELGITRAGFRQWRRKYNISQKPLQLRLEQLELALSDANRRRASRRETVIQKILARKAGLKRAEIGEIVNAEPDMVMSPDNAGLVLQHFERLGAEKVWNPAKIVIVLDQRQPGRLDRLTAAHRAIRDFAKKHKIKSFYDIGEGICHQVVLEYGHVLPGYLVLGTDPHVISYGSLAAVSADISASEMAVVWATGRIWLKVPETMKMIINGRLARGVYAKDIVLKLMRDLTVSGANYKSVEFYGPTVASMSLSERFTLTDLSGATGAKSAMAAFDDTTARFLRKTAKVKFAPVTADPDAAYSDEVDLDVAYLTPQVACPHNIDNVQPVEEVAGKRVDQVIVGSCANGRIDDLEIAAKLLRGRHVSREVRMIIIPGSRRVLSEALDRGFIRTFIDSGCMVLNPGCGPCISTHQSIIESGERALTTANCSCKTGSHSPDFELYQASPATAVATALEGAIADPRKYVK